MDIRRLIEKEVQFIRLRMHIPILRYRYASLSEAK